MATWVLSDITYGDEWWTLFIAAAVFTIVNTIVKPILTILSIPFIIVMSVAYFLISVLMLYITDWVVPDFEIETFWSCSIAAVIVSVVNWILHAIVPGDQSLTACPIRAAPRDPDRERPAQAHRRGRLRVARPGAGRPRRARARRDRHRRSRSTRAARGPTRRSRRAIAAADAVIVVTPEYHHGYTGELRLVLDGAGPGGTARRSATSPTAGVRAG